MTLEPKRITILRALKEKRRTIGPFSLLGKGWEHKTLVALLIKREIELRYKGSLLGILWTLLTPILMLFVYTFVFTVIFGMRWGTGVEHKGQFALGSIRGTYRFWYFLRMHQPCTRLIVGECKLYKEGSLPLGDHALRNPRSGPVQCFD